MSAPFHLRPAGPDDRPHLFSCFAASHPEFDPLPEEQRASILEFQFDSQEFDYMRKSPQSERSIILAPDGSKAGMLWTDRRDGEIRILDFIILPGHRGSGIGQSVIQTLQATDPQMALSIHVETHGGHIPFFEKRGFSKKETYPTTILMEWHPGQMV